MDENKNENAALKKKLGLKTLHSHLSEFSTLSTHSKKPLFGLQNYLLNSSKVEREAHTLRNSYFLPYNNFLKKWENALPAAKNLGKSAALAHIQIDHVEKIRVNHGESILSKIEEEFIKELSDIKTAFRFIGKTQTGTYIIASIGNDAELIATIELLRRKVEKKVFHVNSTYFRITISGGISSSESQKSSDPYALLTYAEYALKKAQTKGINSVQAA